MRSEATRIYGREYQRAVRAGRGRPIAAQVARAAVQRATGQAIGARPNRVAEPRLAEGPAPRRRDAGLSQAQKVDVPPALLADQERIKQLSHATIVGHLMGDPLPGRGALDRRG